MCISVSLVAVDGKGEEIFLLASWVFLFASWDHVWAVVITHLYLSAHTLRRVSLLSLQADGLPLPALDIAVYRRILAGNQFHLSCILLPLYAVNLGCVFNLFFPLIFPSKRFLERFFPMDILATCPK